MRTLVIVDVQNDFLPGGALAVPGGQEVVSVINAVSGRFDLVVATQDWHPPDHVSFAANHAGRQPFEEIDLDGLAQTLWPVHCVQGTPGASFHPDLDLTRAEAVIRKGADPRIDSYSGFFDNHRRRRTGLAGYLREREAVDLYFCGLAAEICVAYTLRDALELGFKAALIEDATRPLDAGEYRRVRRELGDRGAGFVVADALG